MDPAMQPAKPDRQRSKGVEFEAGGYLCSKIPKHMGFSISKPVHNFGAGGEAPRRQTTP
jgi:transposase